MKSFYTIVISTFLASNIFAQDSKLLQNFKYRIDNYKAVGLSAGASGGINREYFSSTNNTFGADISGGFNFISSTDTRKTMVSANLAGVLNKSKNNSSSIQKYSDRYAASSIYLDNTWYKGKSFVEIGTIVSTNLAKIITKNNNVEIGNIKNNYLYLATKIGVGSGRLENVTDMQNALWIYRALKKDNKLNRELSAEELNNLAKSITKGKNTRVLDFRRRTKFILKTVDGYLQEKGIVSKTDIDYFNILNDNLFLANNLERLAGKLVYFNLNPQILGLNNSNFQNINLFTQQYNNEAKDLTAIIGFKKYLPQNLKHQSNYGFALKVTMLKYTETNKNIYANNVIINYDNSFNIQQYGTAFFYEHSIYPNTRTILNIRADANAGLQVFNKIRDNFAKIKFGAGVSYFLNYHTTFIADLGLNYQNNIFDYYQRGILMPNSFFASTRLGLDINL